jgi:hypothetical protein
MSNAYPKRRPSHPGRIDIIPKEFDNLLEDQGSRVRITPTALCPNRTGLHDTNHVLDCPICFGDEVLEFNDKCIEDWAFIQGIKLDKQMEVPGIFDLKDATITTRAGIRMYYWYKVEVLDFASVFNQLIMRGSGDTDKTRYNPAPNCDTPYYCIDSAGKQYTLNEHYKVEDRKIRWTSFVRPMVGKLYSFVYPILPTFRVLELLHDNRYYYSGFKSPIKTPVQLPQQALIRWDYIAKRSGSAVE